MKAHSACEIVLGCREKEGNAGVLWNAIEHSQRPGVEGCGAHGRMNAELPLLPSPSPPLFSSPFPFPLLLGNRRIPVFWRHLVLQWLLPDLGQYWDRAGARGLWRGYSSTWTHILPPWLCPLRGSKSLVFSNSFPGPVHHLFSC